LGLTPQSIYKFGTYSVRAKEEAEAKKALDESIPALKEAQEALKLVNSAAINEIKALPSPPAAI
jgi:ketopantoate hydroxymethyltransferase